MRKNLLTQTDSYKLNHWNQYPPKTQAVYSYFESRNGAQFPTTTFFGLQAILKEDFVGQVVTQSKIDQAVELATHHFGNPGLFNKAGWQHILDIHGGYLPLSIRAVPEGTAVPVSNVLMTVENTDSECFWLTNFVESRLTHVWHPSTVATLSRAVKMNLRRWLERTAEDGVIDAALMFMLHDFGYRGVAGDEAARMGGAGHLLNFFGTDTVPAMELAVEYYGASYEGLAYSVPATEHSVMTARGRNGEAAVLSQLLDEYQEGILSVVGDSYDIYHFVSKMIRDNKDKILARRPNAIGACKFVVRPDSVSPQHPDPGDQVVWIMKELASIFGYETNIKGCHVLNPKVGVLWGDGIDKDGIDNICRKVAEAGFSTESLVFGMGGGLLQKVNRDTQRFAFKSCAQKRDGEWHDVYKEPTDASKTSKRGRMKLIQTHGDHDGVFATVPLNDERPDVMVEVFRNGVLKTDHAWAEIRERAASKSLSEVA